MYQQTRKNNLYLNQHAANGADSWYSLFLWVVHKGRPQKGEVFLVICV